jgi:hypothetical protein
MTGATVKAFKVEDLMIQVSPEDVARSGCGSYTCQFHMSRDISASTDNMQVDSAQQLQLLKRQLRHALELSRSSTRGPQAVRGTQRRI